MLTVLFAVFVIGWIAASIIGTQAYFKGEQTKTIHERNWNSASFEQTACSITGGEIDWSKRIPAFNSNS